MAESMIERVARAIYETWAQEKGAEADWPLVCEAVATTNEQEFPALHETYSLAINEARAAIEAMREPTDAMVDAGFDAGDDTVQGYSENADPQDTWQAMIDAALNEQVSG